jgi:hypothetical protein
MDNNPIDYEAALAVPSNSSEDAITSHDIPPSTADCLSTRAKPPLEDDEVVRWPLTNGGITKISPGDVDAVAQQVWRAVKIAGHTYAYTTLDHRRAYLHRFLCGAFKYFDEAKCTWKTAPIDHVDNDGLNNTRPNLRICTPRQNQQNGIGHPTLRRSRFKGVSFCKNRSGRPWRTVITVKGRRVNGRGLQLHGGYFAIEEEAARRYNVLASEHFGEFARLNDVDNEPDTKSVLTGGPGPPQTGLT